MDADFKSEASYQNMTLLPARLKGPLPSFSISQTRKIADAEVDSTGDIAGVCITDLAAVLSRNGLPTSRSGVRLNELELSSGSILEKVQTADFSLVVQLISVLIGEKISFVASKV